MLSSPFVLREAFAASLFLFASSIHSCDTIGRYSFVTGKSQRTIQLQPRDLALLRGLFESRLMTLSHIASLYFQQSMEAAKKRTQKLRAAGLLAERPRRLYEPTILHLTKQGLHLLSCDGYLNDYPLLDQINIHKRNQVSELTLRHELAVLDIVTAISGAINKDESLHLAERCTWPRLFQCKIARPALSKLIVRADGFLRVTQTHSDQSIEHAFFLEVDRSTESQEKLIRRILGYRAFYKHGGMALWNGKPADQYRSFPFRVLIVLQNDERRNNAAEHLLRCSPPILSQVWLTTQKEIIEGPLGNIWITPSTYRAAVAKSAFAGHLLTASRVYRRKQEREHIVASNVMKSSLFSTTKHQHPEI